MAPYLYAGNKNIERKLSFKVFMGNTIFYVTQKYMPDNKA